MFVLVSTGSSVSASSFQTVPARKDVIFLHSIMTVWKFCTAQSSFIGSSISSEKSTRYQGLWWWYV